MAVNKYARELFLPLAMAIAGSNLAMAAPSEQSLKVDSGNRPACGVGCVLIDGEEVYPAFDPRLHPDKKSSKLSLTEKPTIRFHMNNYYYSNNAVCVEGPAEYSDNHTRRILKADRCSWKGVGNPIVTRLDNRLIHLSYEKRGENGKIERTPLFVIPEDRFGTLAEEERVPFVPDTSTEAKIYGERAEVVRRALINLDHSDIFIDADRRAAASASGTASYFNKKTGSACSASRFGTNEDRMVAEGVLGYETPGIQPRVSLLIRCTDGDGNIILEGVNGHPTRARSNKGTFKLTPNGCSGPDGGACPLEVEAARRDYPRIVTDTLRPDNFTRNPPKTSRSYQRLGGNYLR